MNKQPRRGEINSQHPLPDIDFVPSWVVSDRDYEGAIVDAIRGKENDHELRSRPDRITRSSVFPGRRTRP